MFAIRVLLSKLSIASDNGDEEKIGQDICEADRDESLVVYG